MESLPNPFCVREQIRTGIDKRIEAFQKGYRQNIGILGQSGWGKTFLVSSVFSSLTRQTGLLPIYVDSRTLDLNHFMDRWLGATLSSVFMSQKVTPPLTFQSLLSALEPIVPKTIEKIQHLKKMLRREKPAGVLKEIFSLTATLSQETQKKVILILEEFQALENLSVADPFGILGKEIMVQKDTLYLVTSSSPERAREIFRDKLSLLFGNFEIMELVPFGFAETAAFLEKQLPGRKFSEAQKKFMIRMTDGHPFYLSLMADRLQSTEDLLESFSCELLDEKGRIALVFQKKIDFCLSLARDGSPYVRALLAVSEGRRKALTISTAIDKRVLEAKKILQRLVREDLLVKRGSFYGLEDPLFRFWLNHVYRKTSQIYIPDPASIQKELMHSLEKEFAAVESEGQIDITSRVEALLKEFRNDVVEVEQKKLQCPHFSEIAFRPTNGRVFPLIAKNPKVRWLCQISRQMIREEDILLFLDETKRYRKKLQRKIIIALDGIEQNARLLAQEAKIQLWNLRSFNQLLDLYGLPKMIVLTEREQDEASLGTVAQSLSPA